MFEDMLLGCAPGREGKAVGGAEEEGTMQYCLSKVLCGPTGSSTLGHLLRIVPISGKGARPLDPCTSQSLDDRCPGGGLALGKATFFSQEQSWLIVEGRSWQIPNS